jgi:hypothetical protein
LPSTVPPSMAAICDAENFIIYMFIGNNVILLHDNIEWVI